MDSLQACFITLTILTIGILILYNIAKVFEIITHKKISLHFLLFNFRQKMWMTIGLGLIFFGFYAFLIYFGSIQLDSKTKQDLFFKAYKNPFDYVYLGLSIFVTLAISIYLGRMLIIRLYNSKKR